MQAQANYPKKHCFKICEKKLQAERAESREGYAYAGQQVYFVYLKWAKIVNMAIFCIRLFYEPS